MTENEVKAIKWIKCVKDNAAVTLQRIAELEPDVHPMLYAGRKERAETIIKGFAELEQYRAIGTVEECRMAMEKQTAKIPDTWGDGYDEDGNMIIDMYNCPNCGQTYEIECDHYKYCPECGQAIDQSNLI